MVEDETLKRAQIRHTLVKGPNQLMEATSGAQALGLLGTARIDLALVSIKLPDMDGFELCRQLRGTNLPLAIILMAPRGDIQAIVQGLALGADDVISLPFHPGELAARAGAALRRVKKVVPPQRTIEIQHLKIELTSQKCLKHGREVNLTPKEFHILTELWASRGTVMSRSSLSERIWGERHHGSEKSLEVYIGRLRQKIEDNPDEPTLIRTVRGSGYLCE